MVLAATICAAASSTRPETSKAESEVASSSISMSQKSALTTSDLISMELSHGAHTYHSIPVVLSKGDGVFVWDTDGRRYFDCLSAYSALNFGHRHPQIIKALLDQAAKVTLVSRAFHSDVLSQYTKFITEYFKYDKVLPMNTGVEGGETAIKLARKWAYEVKKVPTNSAKIIFAENNFWGRTITACSSSSDPQCFTNFGPFTPGMLCVPYGDLSALERVLTDPTICAFYIEPVQGEAGVIVPPAGYLKGAYDLCQKKNVLFIADEIQTGLGRTGKLLCCDHEAVRPNILILGKALSGGALPVSAVLCDDAVMNCIKPGEHGSTYGGNPLGCAVAMAALTVLKEENLAQKAEFLGQRFRRRISDLQKKTQFIKEVRGKGLLNAIEIFETSPVSAWDICIRLAKSGVLAKPTHGHIIRIAPPLIITEAEMDEVCNIIESVFLE